MLDLITRFNRWFFIFCSSSKAVGNLCSFIRYGTLSYVLVVSWCRIVVTLGLWVFVVTKIVNYDLPVNRNAYAELESVNAIVNHSTHRNSCVLGDNSIYT